MGFFFPSPPFLRDSGGKNADNSQVKRVRRKGSFSLFDLLEQPSGNAARKTQC
jgi:hypothetical protein